ncbi:Uma2 family endonuclease [Cohnella herbarum]|uniref:Uma2 family endonuclease n=1 Tax=Cohnella herbarum TaxID=2728023 RepID=A0A7Z2ZQZ5_9BACL|nr:Uma2 family endonuclease [Cohnella herbarum]QJD87547.1 Uma2 family endonuclease [Cohnella herbarum]
MGHDEKRDKVREQQQSYGEPEGDFPFEDEVRFEIVEGVRYDLTPAPTVTHQQLLAEIFVMVYHTCHPNGEVLFSPLDVFLDEDNHFQPDLVYILHENSSIINAKRIEGAPDLVAEILSPSTSHNDKIRKKRQYEKHGVKEYWVIDPVHRLVDQFILSGGKYVLHETYGITGRMNSPMFSCVDIDIARLFRKLTRDEVE